MRTSLLIAAHNEGESLWRTVRACLETCAGLDHEIVMADDASTDDSLEEVQERYPNVRIVHHPRRLGASPTKHSAAVQARGEVLVFLDGHCNPEPGAIRRLVEGVELLEGKAVLMPTIAALNTRRWQNCRHQRGHGYRLGLEKLDCGWLPLGRLRETRHGRRLFHESPALIGCALVVSRELYESLHGFDPHMFMWGVEDLDFGLRTWLTGYPILHDSEAVVGHRFRKSFDNYGVPAAQVLANQFRLARKNFSEAVWRMWLDRCRLRHPQPLAEHPEGLWARAWELFQEHRASAEAERSYHFARRVRDEFQYAERFGLSWPKLVPASVPASFHAALLSSLEEGSPSPSPSPSPAPDPLMFLDLAGKIELVSPCQDLSLPGYPANSDDLIKLEAKFSLSTEDDHTYEYRGRLHVIRKTDCEILINSSTSKSGSISKRSSATNLDLDHKISRVPAGIYELRVWVEVRRAESGDPYSLFHVRSCLFKVGSPSLVGWTGHITAMNLCGDIEAGTPFGGLTKARVQVLANDPNAHQFSLKTTIWNRSTGAVLTFPAAEEAVGPGGSNDLENPIVRTWSAAPYQHIVELRGSSGRGTDPDFCKNYELLQRIQCFFTAVAGE